MRKTCNHFALMWVFIKFLVAIILRCSAQTQMQGLSVRRAKAAPQAMRPDRWSWPSGLEKFDIGNEGEMLREGGRRLNQYNILWIFMIFNQLAYMRSWDPELPCKNCTLDVVASNYPIKRKYGTITVSKTNVVSENRHSQKECGLPTRPFQVLC